MVFIQMKRQQRGQGIALSYWPDTTEAILGKVKVGEVGEPVQHLSVKLREQVALQAQGVRVRGYRQGERGQQQVVAVHSGSFMVDRIRGEPRLDLTHTPHRARDVPWQRVR